MCVFGSQTSQQCRVRNHIVRRRFESGRNTSITIVGLGFWNIRTSLPCRVDIDWLFEKVNLDSSISTRYVRIRATD